MIQRLLASALVAACFSCGGEAPQLKVVGAANPGYPAPATSSPREHVHNDSTIELPSDEQIVEPDHPATATPQERALTHVHVGDAVCSGVVLSPLLVLTAHQCVAPDTRGVAKLAQPARVEIASSTLTWSTRKASRVVAPGCDWKNLNLAVLVLDDAADWVAPPKMTMAPGPGADVQALGFGRCPGESRKLGDRFGSVIESQDDALVIDVPLCRGDVGGPVVDKAAGQLVGVISHQDDPDGSPRHTTTIFRSDSPMARALVEQARAVSAGTAASDAAPVRCDE